MPTEIVGNFGPDPVEMDEDTGSRGSDVGRFRLPRVRKPRLHRPRVPRLARGVAIATPAGLTAYGASKVLKKRKKRRGKKKRGGMIAPQAAQAAQAAAAAPPAPEPDVSPETEAPEGMETDAEDEDTDVGRAPLSSAAKRRPWVPIPRRPLETESLMGGKTKKPAQGSKLPPSVPGEPPDVTVAATAAANTMGVPPAVAMSAIAAARAGDKQSKAQIEAAAKVYQAAQAGDPVAKAQMERVRADAAKKDPAALRKAAYLAAAVGVVKGRRQWSVRKGKAKPERVAAAAPTVAPRRRFELIRFGGQPGPFLMYYQGIRG